mmetsp:Transcript_17353/g.66112  ORF Transcript_17353/g.66112 Transcript_17353/m.66112 type:complete len:116 (-) Transcript_17353:1165-1512(-)
MSRVRRKVPFLPADRALFFWCPAWSCCATKFCFFSPFWEVLKVGLESMHQVFECNPWETWERLWEGNTLEGCIRDQEGVLRFQTSAFVAGYALPTPTATRNGAQLGKVKMFLYTP